MSRNEDLRAREIYTRPYDEKTQETLKSFFKEVQTGDTVEFYTKHPSEEGHFIKGIVLDLFATVPGVLNVQRLERIAKGEQIPEREPVEIGVLVKLVDSELTPLERYVQAIPYGYIRKYTILSRTNVSFETNAVAQIISG